MVEKQAPIQNQFVDKGEKPEQLSFCQKPATLISSDSDQEARPQIEEYLDLDTTAVQLSPILELEEGERCSRSSSQLEDEADQFNAMQEMEETSFVEGEIINSEGQDVAAIVRDDLDQLVDEVMSHKTEEEADNTSPDGSPVLPETPPEVLRDRINKLRTEFEYLSYEHQELSEFTTLEKQISHDNCIPRDKVISMDAEYILMNEELSQKLLQKQYGILAQKDIEIEALKEIVQKCKENENTVKATLYEFGEKLTEYMLQDVDNKSNEDSIGCESNALDLCVNGNNNHEIKHSHVPTFTNSLPNDLVPFKDILEQFVLNRTQLEAKVHKLEFNCTVLHSKNDVLENKLGEFHKNITSVTHENEHIKEKLTNELNEKNKLLNDFISTEGRLKDTKINLHSIGLENTELLNKINNLKKSTASLEEEFEHILNIINKSVDFLDCASAAGDDCDQPQECPKPRVVHSCSNIKTIAFKIIDTVNTKRRDHFKLYFKLGEINNHITCLKLENNELKSQFSALKDFLNLNQCNAICELEATLKLVLNQHFNLENKIKALGNEKVELENMLSTMEKNLNKTATSLEETCNEKIRLEREVKNFEIQLGNKLIHDANDNSEGLYDLKEKIIQEITSLDDDENEEDLLTYLPIDLFNKLMEAIIQKQNEVSCNLHSEHECIYHSEAINTKLKSHQCLINDLEIENDNLHKKITALSEKNNELECKIKKLTNTLTHNSNEIKDLNARIVELTTKNDDLYEDLELAKSENDKMKLIKEDVGKKLDEKNDTIEHLKEKILDLGVEKNNSSQKDSHDYQDISLNKCSLSISPNVARMEDSLFNEITDTHQIKNMSIIQNLRQEKSLLRDSLDVDVLNVDLSEILHGCADNLILLKDVVKVIAEKITVMERRYTDHVDHIQTNINNKDKSLNYLKSGIVKCFHEINKGIITVEDDNSKLLSNPSCCGDVVLKNELNLFKVNTPYSSTDVGKLDQNLCADVGIQTLQRLRNAIQNICNEMSKNNIITQDLETKINLEVHKSTKKEAKLITLTKQLKKVSAKKTLLEDKVESLSSEINEMSAENTLLEGKVESLLSGIASIKSALLNIDNTNPFEIKGGDLVNYVQKVCKEYKENVQSLVHAENNVIFFSTQLDLLRSHVMNLEHQLHSSCVLIQETAIIKQQLTNLDIHLNERNVAFGKLFSKLRFKVSSLNQGVDILLRILDEYYTLKADKKKWSQQQQKFEETIRQLSHEKHSLQNVVSSLKLEMATFEDVIRNLRSEVRSCHLHCQKKGKSVFAENGKSNTGTQTENACCMDLYTRNLEQQKILNEQNNRIATLQRDCNNTNTKKVNDLEQALDHAKQIIRNLKVDLSDLKRFNNEVLESYNAERENKEKSSTTLEGSNTPSCTSNSGSSESGASR